MAGILVEGRREVEVCSLIFSTREKNARLQWTHRGRNALFLARFPYSSKRVVAGIISQNHVSGLFLTKRTRRFTFEEFLSRFFYTLAAYKTYVKRVGLSPDPSPTAKPLFPPSTPTHETEILGKNSTRYVFERVSHCRMYFRK